MGYPLQYSWASLVAQLAKNPPAMQETWVSSLGREDPLEEGMQPTPVFLPGGSHGQRSLAGYSPWGHKESDTTEQLTHLLAHICPTKCWLLTFILQVLGQCCLIL